MAVWTRLMLAAAAAAAAAVLLTALPQADRSYRSGSGDIAVFRAAPVKRLTTDNLVDSMIALRLELPISKVAWKQAVLSVDLVIGEKGNISKAWLHDLQRLLALAFAQTDNVNRVLVRFVETKPSFAGSVPSGTQLLAAADVRRTDAWLASNLQELAQSDPLTDPLWKQRLRLSVMGDGALLLGGKKSGETE